MIDDGIPDEWDEAVRLACMGFRQGSLVEAPPFIYVATPAHGIWSLTRASGDDTLAEDLFELEERPPYGLITTETCDVSEEAANHPRQPWISVAPVYDLEGRLENAQEANLRANRVNYLRLLSPPALPAGFWVADLRIEVPLEKSWLVGRTAIESLVADNEYEALAHALAGRRERPVYSNDVHIALTRPLRRWVEGMRPARRSVMLDSLLEVRISFAGSPLDPDGAGLVFISDSAALSETARAAWEGKWVDLKRRMDEVGIPLLANEYHTLDSCPARRYLNSYQIDLTFAL